MLHKKRRHKDWCPGGGRHITFTVKEKIRKAKPGLPWTHEEVPKQEAKVVMVRCPGCDQRFETYNTEDCCGNGIGSRRIPRHKATVREAKMPRLRKLLKDRAKKRMES